MAADGQPPDAPRSAKVKDRLEKGLIDLAGEGNEIKCPARQRGESQADRGDGAKDGAEG